LFSDFLIILDLGNISILQKLKIEAIFKSKFLKVSLYDLLAWLDECFKNSTSLVKYA